MTQPPDGQEAALAALRSLASAEDRAPRTLLLAGPEGVGRRSVARWYAALLNCEARLDDPCGRCAACIDHTPDADGIVRSSDYREIAPATKTRDGRPARRPQLRIDQLVPRDGGADAPLGPWLQHPPVRRHRIGVIDRAETLTDEAANAFLKTLEEPPRHATIILVAPGPDTLHATVASRCTTVRLVPAVPSAAVRTALAPHPALRLGRPGAWRAALADPLGTAGKRAAVATFVDALDGSLADAFAAADALAACWEGGDDAVPGLLREAWRASDIGMYLAGDAATGELERAWGAYAQRDLALRAWVLQLRRYRGASAGPRRRGAVSPRP